MRRTGLLLATAALAMLLAGGVAFLGVKGPAEAAFPGHNGRIAYGMSSDFSTLPHGDEPVGLITVLPDGTQPQRVHWSEYTDDHAWSADGTKIAYTDLTPDAESYQIFVVNQDGSERKQLTYAGEDGNELYMRGRDPAWSPDGKKLVFERSSYNGVTFVHELYTMNADGSEQQPMGVEGYNPDWSPDGQRIVFSRYTPGRARPWSLCTITPSGTDRDCFAQQKSNVSFDVTGAGSPDFSPDGRKVLYASGHSIMLTRVGAGEGKTIYTNPSGYPFSTCFSPDGKKVAFSLWPSGGGPPTIYTMHLDGTHKSLLTVGIDPDWGPRSTTTTAP